VKECPVCRRCLDDAADACPDDGTAVEPTLPGPVVLDGKYRLERRLGAGGMGVVFRARHLGLGRDFAVKLIRGASGAGSEYLARFRTEAAALGRLKHPGIVDVADFGVDPREGGTPYLAMEHLEGRSLEEHLRESGPLAFAGALPVLDAIAQAIDFAHSRGVLHRDLKPANVLLVSDGPGPPRVKLLDFGLARLAETSRTMAAAPTPDHAARLPREGRRGVETMTLASEREEVTLGRDDLLGTPIEDPLSGTTVPGQLLGTPAYMAPERFSTGESSPAADVYALGVTAFVLLTGRTPFSGPIGVVARGHLAEEPPRPSEVGPGVPEGVDAVLLRALAKRPEARPASAGAFVAALRSVALHEAVRAWRSQEVPRRLGLALAAAASLTALAPFAGRMPPVADLERRAMDVRARLAPQRPLDARLLVVTLDEASLAGEARSLADLGGPVASSLERVLSAGAQAVAIDLLLPESWGRSEDFVRLVAAHPGRVALAAHATADGFVGTEAARGLVSAALGEAEAGRLFGLVNLEQDDDGVVRRARVRFPTREGEGFESFAAAGVRILTGQPAPEPPEPARWLGLAPRGSYHLDFAARPGETSMLSWQDLPGLLELRPETLAGRLVLVGAKLVGSGDDVLRVPVGEGVEPGVLVQARAVNTILAGFPVREVPGGLVAMMLALACAGVIALGLCGRSRWPAVAAASGLAAAHLGAAAWLAGAGGRWLVPVAAPVLALGVATVATLVLRRLLPPHPLEREKGTRP
jgi:serine/threonine protein kinase